MRMRPDPARCHCPRWIEGLRRIEAEVESLTIFLRLAAETMHTRQVVWRWGRSLEGKLKLMGRKWWVDVINFWRMNGFCQMHRLAVWLAARR